MPVLAPVEINLSSTAKEKQFSMYSVTRTKLWEWVRNVMRSFAYKILPTRLGGDS